MKRLSFILAALCLAAAALPGPAGAAITLKYGHVSPPSHGQNLGVEAFARFVTEQTKGEIVVKNFPMGQLGGERSLAEQVQAGTLEMATISTAVLENFVPQVAVMDLPFVFPSREAAHAVIDDPAWQEKLFSYLPAKGFVGIGWTENEFRDITNNKRPVRTPADVKGLKIRVMESPVYIDTFKALGASPVGIPFPEIYNALQQGVIDAQENPLYTSILIKATEVNKYVTKTGHILTECIQIVSPEVWDSLTPEQKRIFKEGAKLALKVNREETAKQTAKLPKLNVSVDEYAKANGVEVITLTPAERQAFVDAVKPVWAKYRQMVGPELYDYFMAAIAKHSKQ